MTLRIHGVTFGSRVNGPGLRHVVHLQGCTLACPGCFNPTSHPAGGGAEWEADALAAHLLNAPCDGVSVSGGEPFQQPEGLAALCAALRARRPELSLLAFSGYTLAELRADPRAGAALGLLDVLVDGRFEVKHPAEDGLRGSTNQVIHLLTPRHRPEELAFRGAEILITRDGRVTLTGFPPGALVGALRRG